MLAMLLRWNDQRAQGRRCRWCGTGSRRSTCSVSCREQMSAFWDLGN